jgi:hypothetical protein
VSQESLHQHFEGSYPATLMAFVVHKTIKGVYFFLSRGVWSKEHCISEVGFKIGMLIFRV